MDFINELVHFPQPGAQTELVCLPRPRQCYSITGSLIIYQTLAYSLIWKIMAEILFTNLLWGKNIIVW